MDIMLGLFFSGVIGYLLGSVNTSLVVGKFYGIDVRQHGSGNAGMTNTLRTIGKKAALFVAIGDIAKGIIACLIGLYICGNTGMMMGGFAAVIGHNFPLYFKFKGGKGALTSISVVLMLDWRIGLIILIVFIIIVALTRYVSLGSIIGAILLPVLALLFHKGTLFAAFAAVMGLLVIIRHHANIKRLMNGTESKLGRKKNSV